MAKKQREALVEELKQLLRDRMAASFDRQPAPGFAEGELTRLAEQIIELVK